VTTTEAPPCDGCLGDLKCWVCLGHGVNEKSRGRFEQCHRCFGSGKCPWCQVVAVRDLGKPPIITP